MRRSTWCCVSLESLLIGFYVCLIALLPLPTPSSAAHSHQTPGATAYLEPGDNGETHDLASNSVMPAARTSRSANPSPLPTRRTGCEEERWIWRPDRLKRR